MTSFADKSILDALTGSLTLALPEIALVAFACLLILQSLVIQARAMHWLLAFTGLLTATGLSISAIWIERDFNPDLRFAAPILPGAFAEFVRWLTLGSGFLLLLMATKEVRYGFAGEYYGCLLIVLAGCSLTARANDLVTLFIALEMISIPTYVLLYLPARGPAGQEAAAKYFLLSVLSSAVLLFGLSYLYGLGGSTNISALVETLADAHRKIPSPITVLAMVLTLAGLGFRITAVPFHYYAPDVYQGGPTGVIAQLAVVPKIAGFVVLARLLALGLTSGLPFPNATQIPLMLWVLAAVTMTLGNLMALVQENLKRVMAYSGIAHAGYLLLAFVAGSAEGKNAGLENLLVYLVAYVLMTLGFFAILLYLRTESRSIETVDDLAGVGRTDPLAAACMAVALLSLIGLPLTAGFAGKLLLFFGLFDAPTDSGLGVMYRVLAIVAAINAAVGAVYYLRLLGVIYLRTPLNPEIRSRGFGALLAAILCACGTLVLGTYPKPLLEAARFAQSHR